MKEGFTLIKSAKLASNQHAILSAEHLIDDICGEYNINEDVYGNVLISVTEAVNNAVFHGNSNDSSLFLDLGVYLSDTEVCFVVSDKGNGFDYDDLPDPTSPDNLLKENGRGVFLMRSLSDDLTFENAGSTVLLYFSR